MDNTKNTYNVTGMGCTACAARIETILKNQGGVSEAKVNFAEKTVEVTHTVSIQHLQEALQPAGYSLI